MPSHGKGMLLTPLRFRRTYLSRALIILAVFFAVSGLVASVAVPGPREEPGQPGSQSGRILDPTNTVTTLDREHGAGRFPSVAIGSDGLALISFMDANNMKLMVAHCLNVACTGAVVARIDNAGYVGGYVSLAIGSDGLGLISYFGGSNGHLMVVHCLDTACSGATLATVDGGSYTGHWTSITIGSGGVALVSYMDMPDGG